MSVGLRFFATPEEFDRVLEACRVTHGFGAWKLREGSGLESGPIVPAPAVTKPGEVLYLGRPPDGAETASVQRAVTEWGFIMCVRPVRDDAARCLYLGEIMSATELSSRGNPLFVDLGRRMRRMLSGRSVVYRLDGRAGHGSGARFSPGAMDLHSRGYTWRAPGVEVMAYAPPEPLSGAIARDVDQRPA